MANRFACGLVGGVVRVKLDGSASDLLNRQHKWVKLRVKIHHGE
jgi:hypothetical protein